MELAIYRGDEPLAENRILGISGLHPLLADPDYQADQGLFRHPAGLTLSRGLQHRRTVPGTLHGRRRLPLRQ